MNFMTKGGDRGYKALGCKAPYNPHDIDEDDFDNFAINSDLHGLIYTYYKDNPDPKIRVATKPEHIDQDTKEWNNWVPDVSGETRGRNAPRNTTANRAPAPAPKSRAPAPAPAPRTRATAPAPAPKPSRKRGTGSKKR